MMRLITGFLLSVALAFTGLGMAVARGQNPRVQGNEIVICTGVGLTVISIGEDGRPVKTTHVCPDAMMHMAATFDLPRMPAPQGVRFQRLAPTAPASRVSRPALTPSARGPPVGL